MKTQSSHVARSLSLSLGLRYSLSREPLKSSMPRRVEGSRYEAKCRNSWALSRKRRERGGREKERRARRGFSRGFAHETPGSYGLIACYASTQKYVSSSIIQRLREGRDLT